MILKLSCLIIMASASKRTRGCYERLAGASGLVWESGQVSSRKGCLSSVSPLEPAEIPQPCTLRKPTPPVLDHDQAALNLKTLSKGSQTTSKARVGLFPGSVIPRGSSTVGLQMWPAGAACSV